MALALVSMVQALALMRLETSFYGLGLGLDGPGLGLDAP